MCGGNQRSAARRIFLDLFVTADGGVFIFGLYFAYRAGIVLDGGNLLCDLGVYVMAVIVGAVSGLQTVYDLLSRRKSVHFFSRRESYFCRGSYRYGVYRGKVAAGAWKKEDRPKAVYDGGFDVYDISDADFCAGKHGRDVQGGELDLQIFDTGTAGSGSVPSK